MARKFRLTDCVECGCEEFCTNIGGDPVCLLCLEDWGQIPAHLDVDAIRDQIESESHSDADPGL